MITINTLGYAILSALRRKPFSGYDLGTYLDSVWPANRSQIYPLLTKLEQKGLLVHACVEQTGRPNKKIFQITDKGTEILEKWIAKSPADPINRDEFLIKVYSIGLLDEESSIKIVRERMAKLEESIATLSEHIAEIEQTKELDTTSRNFGRYVLFNRKFRLDKEEKEWCQWVLDTIKNKCIFLPILYLSLVGRFSTFFGRLIGIG